jgi:hypothetical protein
MGFFDGLIGNASNVQPGEVQKEIGSILIDNEQVTASFKLIRDLIVFTDKRLILVDKQGVTGKKVDYHSIPYKSISHYSVETAGHLDLDAELKIWISGAVQPAVSKTFRKDNHIFDVQRILAQMTL